MTNSVRWSKMAGNYYSAKFVFTDVLQNPRNKRRDSGKNAVLNNRFSSFMTWESVSWHTNLEYNKIDG